MPQLLFKTSSIIETNPNVKYEAELLQNSNRDYIFVLRSMTEKNPNGNPTVVQVYRINPVDKSEIEKMHDGLLYMHGVKSDKVLDVLASGYPVSHDDFVKPYRLSAKESYCDVSTNLDFELKKGTSYCVSDGRVRKLSFVFLASKGNSAEVSPISDTRGCCFIKSETTSIRQMNGLIPAYLVVFSSQ